MAIHGQTKNQYRALRAMAIESWELRSNQPIDEITPDSISHNQKKNDWPSLNTRICNCTACDLHVHRIQAVCGAGNVNADCLIIGEAPGAEEDGKGEPFVGPAGMLLNEMLSSIGLDRNVVFVANILKCRPPQNRDPSLTEIAKCLPYLEEQIALIDPKLIIAVGRIAAQSLLNSNQAIGRMRGEIYQYGKNHIPLVVTYHPAYLLRSPAQKAKSWNDLLLAHNILNQVN
ncbi:MAG: uracil-DNA glycosylase [Pseudomonadota bacterium]|nr:uracil-DNA glycosylase [Pseudomonadota bacterium]